MIYEYIYETKIGPLLLQEDNSYLIKVSFNATKRGNVFYETPLLKRAIFQIKEYLDGKRETFDLNIKYEGTEFQKEVWQALQKIPFGKTCSYSYVAELINRPKAVRAVGQAIHNNPIAIVIPCHRVIGKNGKLVGFAAGLEMKKKLLKLENAFSENNFQKINVKKY